MAAELERLAVQSAGGVDLFGGTVMFRITAVWPLSEALADHPEGGGGACANNEAEARGSVRCRSFFPVINPGDRWCMLRAIVLGLGDRHFQHLYGAGTGQAVAHFRAFCLEQRAEGGHNAAEQLLQLARLRPDLPAYGVQEVRRVQQALDNSLGAQQVRLVIFEREQACRVIWKGAQRASFNLCLLLQQNAHFGYIQRPAQLFKAIDRRSHPLGCRAVCGLCLRYDGLQYPCTRKADDDTAALRCDQCHFVFPNADCLAAHRQHVDPMPPGGVALLDRRTGLAR
uniref:Ubiquitinyl hydrolase 1 n=1 Tax=Globodera pallida TaxID=36090 RepID=A0A183C673_GLOPA